MKVYNINDCCEKLGENAICTKAVQTAVDECSKTGGIVRFGRGRYVLSTVFLRSNVTIEIPEGTELLGAESYYDYAQEEKIDYPIYQDSSHTYFHPSMFVGIGCENIKITGGGKIDMDKEIARLEKEVEKVNKEIERFEKKLNNEGFVAKAPAEVIAGEKEKLAKYQDSNQALVERLDSYRK